MNLACDNLLQVPNGNKYSVRLGSSESPEITSPNFGSGLWGNRAMAERMRYKFTVTENSSLLTYKYAAVLEGAAQSSHGHNLPNERPPFSIKVGLSDSNGDISQILCASSVVKDEVGLTKASKYAKEFTQQTICVECETENKNIMFDKVDACGDPEILINNQQRCLECEENSEMTDFDCKRSFTKEDIENRPIYEQKQRVVEYESSIYVCTGSNSQGKCNRYRKEYAYRDSKCENCEGTIETIDEVDYYSGPANGYVFIGDGKFKKIKRTSTENVKVGEEQIVVQKEYCVDCSWREPEKTIHYFTSEPEFTKNCEKNGGVCKKTEIITVGNSTNTLCYQSELSTEQLESTYYKDWTSNIQLSLWY
jgi:hypothetical protein